MTAEGAGPPATGDAAAPRVVIADDQTLVRSGFRMIPGAAGIPVVAEAADGGQAVAAVLKHRPDVVLMDLRLPVDPVAGASAAGQPAAGVASRTAEQPAAGLTPRTAEEPAAGLASRVAGER